MHGAHCDPEVEQHGFAAVVGQMDGVIAVGNGEVGCDLAGKSGTCAAIAGGSQGQRQEQSDDEIVETAHLYNTERKGESSWVPLWERTGRSEAVSQRRGGMRRFWVSATGGQQVAVPGRWGLAAGTVYDQPEPEELIELTVIVPARNEEDCLGACLKSLVGQSEEIFELGKDWELVVVDDHSTDGTRQIAIDVARDFAGVTVLEAGKLEKGWTGKANAIWTAAKRARGRWLLFTDADTIHEPGDLRRAIHEATRHKAGMLSYSPRQIVSGLAQRTLMPLVFCELALAYPPAKVSDPNQRIAAANGQFLLVEREAYRRLGGHASVADKVLEDVQLAFLAKRRKVGLRFRYAQDAVSTRMYRSTGAMIEGWTKNLALLFDNSLAAGDVAGSRFSAACGVAGADR
jgi:GT2 family glycosyltransferase